MGVAMSKPYSQDLRQRVIETVEAGASRREAAERFEVSVSSAVRWVQRFVATGIAAAKPSGGSTSPLERHAEWLLGLVAEQPDLTLDEIVAAMHKRRIAGSRTALWRFFERHKITFKKSACSRPSGIERTWLVSANAGFGSKACWTQPGWCLSTRPPPPPTWPGSEVAARWGCD